METIKLQQIADGVLQEKAQRGLQDVFKNMLEYVVSLKKPEINEINGETYSDKPLTRIRYIPYADSIRMYTLTSLVDYIKSGVDKMTGHMIVQVISPTRVELFSQLDEERNRERLVEVNALLPQFDFDTFIEHENFCINLQSKFVDTEDLALVLKFAGTVEDGTVTTYGDDGVSQKATVSTGIASKNDAIVPNPVCLAPYRTFLEVSQPESEFVFRMKQDNIRGITCTAVERCSWILGNKESE